MPVLRSTKLAAIIIVLLCQSLVFSSMINAAEEQLAQVRDLVGPTIKHTPIRKTAAAAGVKEIRATVTDNIAVKEVRLFYRELGSSNRFVSIRMMRELDGNVYVAKLPEISSPGIEYYIEASDKAGNTKPSGTQSMPYKVEVAAVVRRAIPQPGGVQPQRPETPPSEKKGISKWVWLGLGAVAVGALAGGGGDGGGGATTSTVEITAPVPESAP